MNETAHSGAPDRAAQAEALAEQVRQAADSKTPLRIAGGGSKAFYGRRGAANANSRVLDVTGYRGIVSYEPSELVVTAAAGTPLAELEAALAERRQMLGFEPPHFGAGATVGGAVACGLSGPRRPYAGAVRDFVLGVKIINGRGEILSFGGQVMKNVAGYDLSRLMAGALGTLGVILEVSLRVLPLPAEERTLTLVCDERGALDRLAAVGRQPHPLSAAAWWQNRLYLRLSGAASAVAASFTDLHRDGADDAGEMPADQATAFWCELREQRLAFFRDRGDTPLWRFSLAPATPPLQLPGRTLLDWGGAQRWVVGEHPAEAMFASAGAVGGHATLFRTGGATGERAGGGNADADAGTGTDTTVSAAGGEQRFQPLDPVTLKLHQRLKQSFDPAGIFNPGRLYPDF